jgi:hypothetical protein
MPIDIIKPFLELFEKSAKPAGIATNGAHVLLTTDVPAMAPAEPTADRNPAPHPRST